MFLRNNQEAKPGSFPTGAAPRLAWRRNLKRCVFAAAGDLCAGRSQKFIDQNDVHQCFYQLTPSPAIGQ
jgi:hypothetical protein